MLALVVPEQGNLLRVAGGTGICYLPGKRQVQRDMRVRVTVEAVLKFEVGPSHMALGALGDLPVYRVACGTAKGAVFALISPELGVLLSVAGKTNIVAGQRHVQRRMRFLVAPKAVL